MKIPSVYMVTNRKNGVLYIGVTSNLIQRVWQHKHKVVSSFSERYNLDKLVWFEFHETMESAIRKEKLMKTWYRQWKINVIVEMNENWDDLYDSLLG